MGQLKKIKLTSGGSAKSGLLNHTTFITGFVQYSSIETVPLIARSHLYYNGSVLYLPAYAIFLLGCKRCLLFTGFSYINFVKLCKQVPNALNPPVKPSAHPARLTSSYRQYFLSQIHNICL